VLAVGRPGRDVTASFGIISAVGEGWRTWRGTRVDRVLRLDLAIYDGFSGGPLVDAQGGVLGLNNSALARGAPMALAADTVDRLVDELLERGHVRRAFIGVAIHPVGLNAALVKAHGLSHNSGLLVLSVAEDGPAERAGVFVGDVFVEANGQPLRRPTDLLDALASVAAGAQVNVRLARGGRLESVAITPGDRPANEHRSSAARAVRAQRQRARAVSAAGSRRGALRRKWQWYRRCVGWCGLIVTNAHCVAHAPYRVSLQMADHTPHVCSCSNGPTIWRCSKPPP
jgi:hypothetical protein